MIQNNCSNNQWEGIRLYYECDNNIITDNILSDSYNGIYADYYGVSLYWLRKVIKENSLETLLHGYWLSKKFLNFHSGLLEY